MASTSPSARFNFYWITLKYLLLGLAYFIGIQAGVPNQTLLLIIIPYTLFHVLRFLHVAHRDKQYVDNPVWLYTSLPVTTVCVAAGFSASTLLTIPAVILFFRFSRLLLEALTTNELRAIFLGLSSAISRYALIHIVLLTYFHGSGFPTTALEVILFGFTILFALILAIFCLFSLFQHWRRSDPDQTDVSQSDSTQETDYQYLSTAPPDLRNVVYPWLLSSPTFNRAFAWYDALLSRVATVKAQMVASDRFGNLFKYEQQYELRSTNYWEVLKSPLLLAAIGIIAVVVRNLIGFGPSVTYLSVGFATLMLTELYVNVAEMFLPEGETLSNKMKLLIFSWILVVGDFLPNTELANLATRPLLVIIFLYVAYRLGLLYGFLLTIIGGGLLFSVESFLRLVQFLHLNGYISDLAAFLLVLAGLGIMTGVIYVLMYTLKDPIEQRSKDVFYLLVGVTTWIFTWIFTDIFSLSYSLEIPDQYITIGHLPVFLTRIVAILLIGYALGRLYLKVERRVLTADSS